LPIEGADDAGVDRLFRTLVPVVNGRRPGHEIVHRLRRKWDLGHSWQAALDGVREHVRALVDLKGPAGVVLDRLALDFEALAPESVASLRALFRSLADHGVDLDRVELDLGFGRGIGFYSQMVFEIVAPTPDGPVEVCGGGRYDGLARVFGSDRDDRGVGFAFGLERVARVLEAQGVNSASVVEDAVLLIPGRPEAIPQAVRLATALRSRGFRAILEMGDPGELIRDGGSRAVVVGDERGDDSLILHDRRRPSAERVTPQELIRIVAESAGELKP
jgi:histidyl-tRNA synthetase